MRALRRLTCIWRAEKIPISPAATESQPGGEPQSGQQSQAHPRLVCIHNKDPELCVICSRNWANPETGQLPYRPKAA